MMVDVEGRWCHRGLVESTVMPKHQKYSTILSACFNIKGNIHGALPCHVMMCNGPPPSEWRLMLQLLPMGWFPSKWGEWREFWDDRDGFPEEGSRSIARSQILQIYAVFIVFARDLFLLLCAR